MSAEQFAALPESIEIRELRYTISERGFRTKTITLATTWLDSQVYELPELATLFRDRRAIEIFFRFFKHLLGCRHLLSDQQNGIALHLR